MNSFLLFSNGYSEVTEVKYSVQEESYKVSLKYATAKWRQFFSILRDFLTAELSLKNENELIIKQRTFVTVLLKPRKSLTN